MYVENYFILSGTRWEFLASILNSKLQKIDPIPGININLIDMKIGNLATG